MKTAMIILNYNDYDTTYKMLKRIKDYKELDLILVVDNKSLDDSYSKLKKEENDKIKVIETIENRGYAYGNNVGLRYLKDQGIDAVIISNPDVLVSEKTILELKKDLEKEEVVLVAPKVIEHGEISRGWKLPHFKEDLISNINYFHKYSKKLLSYKESYYNEKLALVEAVHGCFFLIRYNEFKNVHFFDENTFLYYEENILGSKLKKKNYQSYIDTTLQVIHDLSVSVDKNFNSIKKYKILKNSQMYYEKVYNKINIFEMFLLKFTYYLSLFISYLIVFLKHFRRRK